MGLQRYASSRVRFTWRNRCVTKSAPRTSQKVLVDCKDQRAFGGKCSYFSVCAALEAHKRLKTDEPCPELSWTDLEEKSLAIKNVDKLSRRVGRCFVVLKSTGVRYEGSEDILKIEDFERIITGNKHTVDEAIRKYLKEGPMVGSFAVYATTFDDYGQSEFPDEIYVVKEIPTDQVWSHAVLVTGFGVQGCIPFWEFQNSYGPLWRGAARGFGQIYAVHLRCLYGFRLAK